MVAMQYNLTFGNRFHLAVAITYCEVSLVMANLKYIKMCTLDVKFTELAIDCCEASLHVKSFIVRFYCSKLNTRLIELWCSAL